MGKAPRLHELPLVRPLLMLAFLGAQSTEGFALRCRMVPERD